MTDFIFKKNIIHILLLDLELSKHNIIKLNCNSKGFEINCILTN